MKRIALAVAALLLLAGCDNAESGTVTSKQHVAEHIDYVPTCMVYGKYGCTVWIPVPYDSPECWTVNFHNDADDENGSACVDPGSYPNYELGSQYPGRQL